MTSARFNPKLMIVLLHVRVLTMGDERAGPLSIHLPFTPPKLLNLSSAIRPDGCQFASALPLARTRTAVRLKRRRAEGRGDADPAAARIGCRIDPVHPSASGESARTSAERAADRRQAINPNTS